MATWASNLDVLADLDRLSEFSPCSSSTQNFEIVSPQCFGRGTVRTEECPMQLSAVGNKMEDDYLPILPSFCPGSGRGERMLALSRHRQDMSLQQQLRMAMGPGYSNELIEDFIRGDSSREHSEAGQFDDHDSLSEESTTENASSTKEGSISSPIPHSSLEPKCSPTHEELEFKTSLKETNSSPVQDDKTREEITKTKKKPGGCRNALLRNLPNYIHSSCSIENVNEPENKVPSPKIELNLCNRMKLQSPVSEHVVEEHSIANEKHNKFSLRDVPLWLKKDSNNFVYKEEDFPPL